MSKQVNGWILLLSGFVVIYLAIYIGFWREYIKIKKDVDNLK